MEKLKKPKMQHDHTWTDILKIGIFAILMLAPFFAIASKCLYVACNKNAKDSYYGETINEKEYINVNITNLIIGNEYLFKNDIFTPTESDTATTLNINNYVNVSGASYSGNVNKLTFRTASDIHPYVQYYENDTYLGSNRLDTTEIQISFTLESIVLGSSAPLYNYFYTIEYNKYSYLDNAFYYAVDELGEEQVFSWTKQTALYSGINEMTQGLGIDPTNNVLAILLTYWMLLTIVYVIVDIIIVLFVKLTHFITA